MTDIEVRSFHGFEFVKAGTFYLADTPWVGISKGKKWEVFASIKLTSEDFRLADETAYLIISDGDVKYVGEYTYNLSERMLYRNYVNHHKETLIEAELKQGKTVTLWLATHPYVLTPESKEINIAKSIEQEFLRQNDFEWNTRGRIKKWESWRAGKCIRVSKIIRLRDSSEIPNTSTPVG